MKDTEYLVIESTYGDRLHGVDLPDYVTELAKRIQLVLDRGGNMVIPSFAVGRTQEMLYFIREIKERGLVTGHGDFPVYVDSPLAIEATSIFLQCDTEYVDEEMQALIRSGVNPIVFPGLKVAVSQAESQAINEDKTPKVIISASGTCAPSPETQPLAQGEHGAVRRLSGSGHAWAAACRRAEKGQAFQ